jgi:hypothetical protein
MERSRAHPVLGTSLKGEINQNGEGYGFEKPENNLKLYTEMLAFFERHISAKAAMSAR